MNKNKNSASSADKQKLKQIQNLLRQAQKMLEETIGEQEVIITKDQELKTKNQIKLESEHFRVEKYPTGEEVIEGVFDGFQMIGPDGAEYQIPENYASKSKLVEGDLLKLTITPQGRFIYKQIGPIERETKKGILQYQDKEDRYYVTTIEGINYKILKASVTYYKGEAGDEVVVLTPKGGGSQWAALDNIVREQAEILEDQEKASDEGLKEEGGLEEI
ncbi:MAG: hypothetical protein AAB525_00195 [Patescibacteria group bacterium]